jgi:hypothetical protein
MANSQTANRPARQGQQSNSSDLEPMEVGRDVVEYLREYAKENPEAAALWCLGIGFVLGWKLKPW